MSEVSFDKEFVQRLRRVAKERCVKLVLDKSRLADPPYVAELRKHHPLNTTEAQWRYASKISEATGRPLGLVEATNKFRCSRYIDANRLAFFEIAPTKEQTAHAYNVAKRYRVEVPRKAVLNKEAYEEWIATFRKSDVAEVWDIIEQLGWGIGLVKKVMEERDFEREENWTRSPGFIDWMIETYGHLLHDQVAASEYKRKQAAEMMRRGCDRFSVEESLNLPESVVAEIAERLEADEDIIVD
jgi:hypothetical protein